MVPSIHSLGRVVHGTEGLSHWLSPFYSVLGVAISFNYLLLKSKHTWEVSMDCLDKFGLLAICLEIGSLLNLDLAWHPAKPSEPPVSPLPLPHSSRFTGIPDHAWLFMWALGI